VPAKACDPYCGRCMFRAINVQLADLG